jgi:luciferase family oxidoreductase group 1
MRLSVLDLSPVPSGSTSREALLATLELAGLAEQWGYTRYWLAEHHNSPGVASSSPEILIGHVAAVTHTMRVGSGGIMLPNHSSLKVAEQFKMLEALHPGRIDLGLGRAPGTDTLTALALRGSREALARDRFPEQLGELQAWLGAGFPEGHPYRSVEAVPADGAAPPLWMLSSSGYGAQAAAQLGCGLAFAHHINPDPALESLRHYRAQFQPSLAFPAPQAILAVAVCCAPTHDEAEALASSFDLVRLRIARGERGLFPSVAEAEEYPYTDEEQMLIQANRNRFFVGTPAELKAQLTGLAEEAEVDELMLLTMTHGPEARKRSYQLMAGAFGLNAL